MVVTSIALESGMALATFVDVVHALLMVLWIAGLPLLVVWRRFPKLTMAYAIYALAFVLIYQLSRVFLDECFLTTIARKLWYSQAPASAPADIEEWFTVRFAKAVFSASPSHRLIVWLGQALSVATAVGTLVIIRKTLQAKLRAPKSAS